MSNVVRRLNVFCDNTEQFAVTRDRADYLARTAARILSPFLGGILEARGARRVNIPVQKNPIVTGTVNFGKDHPHVLLFTRRGVEHPLGSAVATRHPLAGVANTSEGIVRDMLVDVITGADTTRVMAMGMGAAACGNQCLMNVANPMSNFMVMKPETMFCQPCAETLAAAGAAALAANNA